MVIATYFLNDIREFDEKKSGSIDEMRLIKIIPNKPTKASVEQRLNKTVKVPKLKS